MYIIKGSHSRSSRQEPGTETEARTMQLLSLIIYFSWHSQKYCLYNEIPPDWVGTVYKELGYLPSIINQKKRHMNMPTGQAHLELLN